MPFSEKSELKGERRPLLRDPVWHSGHRYGIGVGRVRYNEDDIDELLGLDNARNQKFRWLLFLSVTFMSILLLLATIGILLKLSAMESPPVNHFPTTQLPMERSQSTSQPLNVSAIVTTPSTSPPLTA